MKNDKISVLDHPDVNYKIPLSVPFIAKYLKAGYNGPQIAKVANVSKQAVWEYIKTHSDELEPLLDKSDELVSITAKHISYKAMRKIDSFLDQTSKKDLIALNAIAGTQLDKYLLIKGQSAGSDQGNLGRNPQVMQQITVNVEQVIVNQIVNKLDNT